MYLQLGPSRLPALCALFVRQQTVNAKADGADRPFRLGLVGAALHWEADLATQGPILGEEVELVGCRDGRRRWPRAGPVVTARDGRVGATAARPHTRRLHRRSLPEEGAI